MAIVSISEAARLTGKSRNTLHNQIRTGKLSTVHNPVTNSKGIDTSELLRVFGQLKSTASTVHQNVQIEHEVTGDSTLDDSLKKSDLKNENIILKAKLEEKEKQLNDKQSHIDSLKQAMRLLEDQRQKTSVVESAEPKRFFQRLFKG